MYLILIVGGSALAYKYNLRGTVDIDADIKTEKGFKRIINKTSERLNIPSDFINNDFRKSYSYSKHIWNDAIPVYKTNLDNVYVVSDLSQLCMKMVSGRKKDFSDLKFLVSKVLEQGFTYKDVLSKLDYLYGGTEIIKKGVDNYVKRVFWMNRRMG